MSEQTWLDLIARLSAPEPVDLDATVFRDQGVATRPLAQQGAALPETTPPSALLWGKETPDISHIGVVVNAPLADPTTVALRLASAAVERGVTPIIMTELADCGFERFGFRIERIVADSAEERAILQQEICQFWDLAIVIDATEASMLG
ncbi:MAG: hypothetical protein ACSHXD_09880 [Marinosulfonomonas sp.]